MKKTICFIFLFVCILFIIFHLKTSDNFVDVLSSISAWFLLGIQLFMYVFPKIKNKGMILIAKMRNYKTILHYTARIIVEIENKEQFRKDVDKFFSREYGNYRLLKVIDDYEITIGDLNFKLITDEDSIYVNFAILKVGYKDVIDEIKIMNGVINKLLRLIPDHGDSVFRCEIKFEEKNPYLTLFLDTKVKSEDGVRVSIITDNSKVTNDSIEYWHTDIVEFNNKLEKELLLK